MFVTNQYLVYRYVGYLVGIFCDAKLSHIKINKPKRKKCVFNIEHIEIIF